jgi:hypothetical protein
MTNPRTALRFSAPFRHRSLRASALKSRILAALISVLATHGFGQSPFRSEGTSDALQIILPWEGPGAAVFNPALAAETRHADARFGYMSTASGKWVHSFVQGTVMSPWKVAAGFAFFSKSSVIDGNNAVYEESLRHFVIAWGDSNVLGTGLGLGAGLSRVTHVMNAFGAVESEANAYDAGIHAATPVMGRAGSLQAGLTFRNLAADEVALPSDNPGLVSSAYPAFLPNYDISFLLKSVFGCVDLYSEFNLHQDQDKSEGPSRDIPFVKSLGLEFRPIPFLGAKVERTWTKRWTAGLVARVPLAVPVFDGILLSAEANISHDKILTEKDEGRGFINSVQLGVAL